MEIDLKAVYKAYLMNYAQIKAERAGKGMITVEEGSKLTLKAWEDAWNEVREQQTLTRSNQ